MEKNKNQSIFFALSNRLSGNKEEIIANIEKRELLTNNPETNMVSGNNIQQKQQDFLDVQSQKVAQDIYGRNLGYQFDRISAYNDFRAMDQSPEISVALDIMADECIAFDTIIPLLNGEKRTVEELFNENKSNFWVYSYNTDKKCIEPAICERIVDKGEQNVYKVTFDDNSFIKVTDQHLFLLKDSKEYIKTKDLKIGDSIQPFYNRISTSKDRIHGYEMLLEDNGKWEYTHRIVKRKFFNDKKGVCHHKNFIKTNNEPDNLEIMNYFDHQKLHASLNSERWKDDVFADKMKKIFSETNKKSGPYWSNNEWANKRIQQARETTTNYLNSLSSEERKSIHGLPGEKNGMFNNGYKLAGEKNGRFLNNLDHEFTKNDIINAFQNSNSIDEACKLLNTNKIILRKSEAYKKLNISRWADLNILISDINFENINRECEKYKSEFILENNLQKICKLNNWNSKIVTKFLKKNNYNSWTEYVKKYDSRSECINKIKQLFLTSTINLDGKLTFKDFCNQYGFSYKQIEGVISISHYKNWKNFTSSFNHSIKDITLVGKERTYDLINVTDNNNYAILTNNGTGVFVHNCVTRSDRGEILTITCENLRIKNELKSLFNDKLNISFSLWFWIRELLKYGDNFLRLDIDQEEGVRNVTQLPVGEVEKVIKKDDPTSHTYNWQPSGLYFEEFQIAHFSLISDGTRIPYGRSILDPARKLWKQLQLAEDAMLVYRLVRAPERRIFYLDVGNSDPADIKQYIESMKRELKKSPVVDQRTGNVNTKFNLMTFEEDYFIPIRGDKSSRIETLPGASNLGDIMDIEYLQNKLFTAIKVPRPYLNFVEGIAGGSTLSQADLRFSRTINRIQEAVVLELRRIANIHLIIKGYEAEDINNFSIELTNPSTQQELLKLETMKARNDVFKEMFSSDATSPVSYAWAMEFILGFSQPEIKQILRQKKIERKIFYEIERAHLEYMDTGIFTELDRKFRKPDFDPNTEIDPETGEPTGGGDEGGGGGGSALQNPLGSMGNVDLNAGGGDMGGDMGADLGGDMGGAPAMPSGAELAGPEASMEPEQDKLSESGKLWKKNNVFNQKTKSLLEGIEHYLNKMNENTKNSNDNNIII